MKVNIDEEAFLKAYDAHADAIFRYFYFRLSDRGLAYDLTQETFIKTWKFIADGKEIQSPQAFLYRVARNLIVDHTRRKKTASLDDLSEQGFEPGIDNRPALYNSLDAESMLHIVNKLDAQNKEVLLMRYVDGFSPKEIAKELNVTANVISVRLHRALEQVRSILSKDPNE